MNDKYYDDEKDWEDNYNPIFDFRPSKWLYDQMRGVKNTKNQT